MTRKNVFPKQPREVDWFGFSFRKWLDRRNTSIQSVEITMQEGIEKVAESVENGLILIKLAEGVSGNIYKAEARITTPDGLVKEAEIYIRVRED